MTTTTKLIGYFVLQNAGDGCIWAKYSNITLDSPLTECAKLISEQEGGFGGFVGTYLATWIENPVKQETDKAYLTIVEVVNKNGIYDLFWKDSNGKIKFTGQGLLFNGLLSGAYWDDK